tara:strand:- start:1149 stop:1910 length:762 start_codon:yes stop_codon:yes gene_type:complete
MFTSGFYVLVRREIKRLLYLYRQTLLPSAISSALYIIVFGQSLGSRIGSIKNIEYIQYIIPGLIMMSVINPAYQNSSSSIMQAKFLRFIEDILITPLSGLEITLGYIIGGTFRGVLNGILVIFLSWLLTGFFPSNLLLTLIYLFTVSWAFSGAGVIIGILAKTWDSIMVFTNFIFTPLIFLGGVFYSIDMLPSFWRSLSMINPLYWMINGLRYASLNIADSSHEFSLGISIAFAIFFSFIATKMFSSGYRIKS